MAKKLLIFRVRYRFRSDREIEAASADEVAEAIRYEIQRNIDNKVSAARMGHIVVSARLVTQEQFESRTKLEDVKAADEAEARDKPKRGRPRKQ